MPEFDFESFLRAFISAALWSSNDEDGEPLNALYSDDDDISPETLAEMRADCADFAEAQAADLAEYCLRMRCEQWSGEDRAGHDFWLTRNGHGAGFWDRGLGALGERLSEAAEIYRGFDLYVGDDGMIYGG